MVATRTSRIATISDFDTALPTVRQNDSGDQYYVIIDSDTDVAPDRSSGAQDILARLGR